MLTTAKKRQQNPASRKVVEGWSEVLEEIATGLAHGEYSTIHRRECPYPCDACDCAFVMIGPAVKDCAQ